MRPIVNGLKAKYGECLDFVHSNFHADSPLRRTLTPIGTPEFFVVDAHGVVLRHWIGGTSKEELELALAEVCGTGESG